MSTFADAAPGYLAIGWQPVPLHVPTDGGCSCGQAADCASPGKHPRTAWPKGQRIDAAQVEEWARRWPAANVGIVTGAVSGLLVLDVDPDHGGLKSLALVERRCGLPPTLSAVSGGGGRHFYLGHPGVTIGPSAGKLGAGLDIRADRGLIVAPPSLHASGRRYSWVDSSVAPAPCPRWMIQALVARPRPRARAVKVSGDVSAFARAVLDRAADKVRQAADGTKHDVLWRQAFHLGTFVGAGLFDAEVATGVLMAALGDRYKSEKAARATVERNIAQGKAKPAEVAS